MSVTEQDRLAVNAGQPLNSFRHGHVHVCSDMCATCVFRPGNLMSLDPGKLRNLIADARSAESAIICHCTLGTEENAVCRGFYDRYKTEPLAMASKQNRIRWQDPPTGDSNAS